MSHEGYFKKAFDSVQWHFLCQLLHMFGFPKRFVHLIMKCVETTHPSLLQLLAIFMASFLGRVEFGKVIHYLHICSSYAWNTSPECLS
jgi:hypothetical protein